MSKPSWTGTVNIIGNGTVTPTNGIVFFAIDQPLHFSATPASGWQLQSFIEEGVDDLTALVPMDYSPSYNFTLTVTFVPIVDPYPPAPNAEFQSAPIPLPDSSSQSNREMGGWSMGQPPDRFSDHALPTAERLLILRWQDNRNGKWSKEHQVSLKTTGDTHLVWWKKTMGQYRSRQFEFILSDPTLFVLLSAEEVLEVLEVLDG